MWGYGIWGISQPCYVLIDLYGQCQQVDLVGPVGPLWGHIGSLWGCYGIWGHEDTGSGIWGIAQPCYVLMDLYGQCLQVGLIGSCRALMGSCGVVMGSRRVVMGCGIVAMRIVGTCMGSASRWAL